MKCILFDIGNLRADHLGCYGYKQPLSPVIDELTRESLCCNAAFSSDVTNAGARAALFSGRFGLANGVVTDGILTDSIIDHTPVSEHGLTAQKPLLNEYLSCNDIHTAAITPFGRNAARWFYDGWCEVYDPWQHIQPGEVRAEDVNSLATSWLENNAAKDFFLYLTYNDLYRGADTPLSDTETHYFSELSAAAAPPHPDEDTFADHFELHAVFSPRYHRASNREMIWKMVHTYNARIRIVDDHIGEILELLAKLGIREETIIILTSDHGVLFGECGCYGGHISAHYHCARIPLIMHAPNVFAAGRLNGFCYQFDIGPTLCDILGIHTPVGYHGTSLMNLLEDEGMGGRDYVVCSHGQYTAQRVIISGEWKLNRTWHGGFWEFDDTELYNIADDTAEAEECSAEHPDKILELTRKLRQWLNEYQPDHADPLARIACQEPPGFLRFGQELRARVRRGEIRVPEGYRGRWA
jgi:arylsulfatase A-like enzyme